MARRRSHEKQHCSGEQKGETNLTAPMAVVRCRAAAVMLCAGRHRHRQRMIVTKIRKDARGGDGPRRWLQAMHGEQSANYGGKHEEPTQRVCEHASGPGHVVTVSTRSPESCHAAPTKESSLTIEFGQSECALAAGRTKCVTQ
ncbi:hypothetical protein Pth03_61910 [Planotetraspora thailandica]|uniref:Uncharacterized protein n=1 Tax=Planotetraspora thailandica TaxID=487172 RepID=A0A8J3XWM5_9ACTN|nr:hypothetical protein Pth03_61910 [Planotetraspora thailandica]